MTRDELLNSLRNIASDTDYYAVTILCLEDGTIRWSTTTHWVGFVDDKPGLEVREGSIVRADRMAEYWRDRGEGYLVVNSTVALALFLRAGGNGLIASPIAKEYLSDLVAPKPAAHDGPLGYKSLRQVPETAFRRAPTPAHRMRTIKRDHYRCRVCGRSPTDHTDVELNVHHIRPFGRGGLTEDDNLITLCHTCHTGLNPHEDHALFDLIDAQGKWSLGKPVALYTAAVSRYREVTTDLIARSELKDPTA